MRELWRRLWAWLWVGPALADPTCKLCDGTAYDYGGQPCECTGR